MQFRAPPFLRCGIAFHGFSEADVKEMEEIAMTNGENSPNQTVHMFLLDLLKLEIQWSLGYTKGSTG